MAEEELKKRDGEPVQAEAPLLAMHGIRKSFSGVEVLHGVDLTLRRGEVLALLGENGAGKSTLIKILNGDYIKDSGEILLDGTAVEFKSPRDAEDAGIKVIYQELNYAPDLSVAENVLLGHLPRWAGFPIMIDWREANRRAQAILAQLNAEVNPQQPMRSLSVGKQQTIEIAKALATRARILVMDEPTAALTPREVNLLFETIASLRQQGTAVIYISHRLDEVEQIAQRVTVLRDGLVAGTMQMADVKRRDIVHMMVGRDLTAIYPVKRATQGEELLSIAHLSRERAFSDINFQVHTGEIVGMFGLLGAGHVEVSKAIFGIEPAASGEIKIIGKTLHSKDPRDAKQMNIGFVPEDRKIDGLILDMTVTENLTLANWKNLSRYGVLQQASIRQRAAQWIERLKIRTVRGGQQEVRTLSGGNQQKVVLARWLEVGSRLLILNEPTRGVDIGARADIYAVLESLREQGLGLLLVSSDMEEVLAMSNRVLVFAKGQLVTEVDPSQTNQETLLTIAAGGDA